MQFLFSRHLLKSSLFGLLALGIAFIQAAREPSGENNSTIHFWLKKGDNHENYFLPNEYEKIATELTFKSRFSLDQYEKKTYQAVSGTKSCIWLTVMQLIKDLNMTFVNPWLELDLLLVYESSSKYDVSDKSPSKESKLVGYLSKLAKVKGDMTIIIGKKQVVQTKSLKIVVDEGDGNPLQKNLAVYPNTTLADLMCYLIYHSDIPQVVKNGLYGDALPFYENKRNYDIKIQKNSTLSLESELLLKTVEEMNSNEITLNRKECYCRFYLNKDGSLLSQEQIGSSIDQKEERSNKIRKGVEGEWDCYPRTIGKGKLFFPFIADLLPGISTMNIMYNTLEVKNDIYQLKQFNAAAYSYINDTTHNMASKTHTIQPSPVTIANAKVSNRYCSLVLSVYKEKNTTDMKCILKQDGKPEKIILEKVLPINQAEKSKYLTYFVEAYLELMNQAGYVIDELSSYPAKITYTTHESSTEKVVSKNMYHSMTDHQKEVHATTYTFVMPKSAKLIKSKVKSQNNNSSLDDDTELKQSKKPNEGNSTTDSDTNNNETNESSNSAIHNNNNILTPNHSIRKERENQNNNHYDTNEIVKYTIITCIVLVALSFVGYLTWKSKKREKTIDSSKE